MMNNNYSQISFLAQLELIKKTKDDQFKAIALYEYYKIKYGLKECTIKLTRIEEKTNLVKRKIRTKRDKNFVYF